MRALETQVGWRHVYRVTEGRAGRGRGDPAEGGVWGRWAEVHKVGVGRHQKAECSRRSENKTEAGWNGTP